MGITVPLVMDGKVGNHTFGNKKLPAVVPDKVGVLLWGNIPRYGKHDSPGKLGVPLFLDGFGGVPQGIAVCVLRRGVGRQHDFGVDDFAFMGIVFLLLVVFGKQPLPALVGGGSDGRLALAALDDFYIMVWAWQVVSSFLPVSGQRKSREPFSRFPARWCRRWAAGIQFLTL